MEVDATSKRQFHFIRELGSGSFGTVHLADMITVGNFRKRVALKLLKPEFHEGSEASQRLRDEARLLGRLRHRNIVSVDDLVCINGQWGVIMEYVSGIDLHQFIRYSRKNHAPISTQATVEVVGAICDALDAAWSQTVDGQPLQVIHRDIKPSNVLLTDSGDVKVLDFGIARASFEGREARTGDMRMGSLAYMAPERILGDEDTPAGDVYAVGCVLYEMLTTKRLGRTPLHPIKQASHVQDALQNLPETSTQLRDLIEACLSYEPTDRPSAREVSDLAATMPHAHHGAPLRSLAQRWIPSILDEQYPQPAAQQSLPSTPPTLMPSPATTLAQQQTIVTAPPDTSQIFKLSAAAGVVVMLALGVGVTLVLRTPAPSPQPTQLTAPPPIQSQGTAAPTPQPSAEEPLTVEAQEAAPADAEPTVSDVPESRPVEPSSTPAVTQTTSTAPTAVAIPNLPTPATEILRAVKFTAPAGSESISATCGDVHGTGTGSVNLRNPPAGECAVTVVVDGATHQHRLTVTQASGMTCTLEQGQLQCQ